MHFQYDLLKFVTERLKNNNHVFSDHTKEPYTWKRQKTPKRYKSNSSLWVKVMLNCPFQTMTLKNLKMKKEKKKKRRNKKGEGREKGNESTHCTRVCCQV